MPIDPITLARNLHLPWLPITLAHPYNVICIWLGHLALTVALTLTTLTLALTYSSRQLLACPGL